MRRAFYFRSGFASGALDVGSLLALRALHDVEGNLFAFLESLETIHVDGRKMGEKVFATIVRGNETKALGVIEPFHSADCHICYFPTKNEQIPGLPDSLFELSDPVLFGNLDAT